MGQVIHYVQVHRLSDKARIPLGWWTGEAPQAKGSDSYVKTVLRYRQGACWLVGVARRMTTTLAIVSVALGLYGNSNVRY
jgi:hypothetical protein